MKPESEQVYHIPYNTSPDKVCVRYALTRPRYQSTDFVARYHQSCLKVRGVPFTEWIGSINKASRLQLNYRGKIVRLDKICWACLGLALFFCIMMGVCSSDPGSSGYGPMLGWLLAYLVFVPVMMKYTKMQQDLLLRQAQFVLAVVCRAENNRYYLKNGIEMRPGYLAKWIEFNSIDTRDSTQTVLEAIKQRRKVHT